MSIGFLIDTGKAHQDEDAIIWQDGAYSYGWLLGRIAHFEERLRAERIMPGTVAILQADFSPAAVALFLALVQANCIVVPLSGTLSARTREYIETTQGQVIFNIDENDQVTSQRLSHSADHELYRTLREAGNPGLVLFSSGSSGHCKAAVHSLPGILAKFRTPRHRRRIMSFLLFDHIGGLNTLLYSLANAGCLVTIREHTPDAVLGAIERHRVEVLPASPTFLNLILISDAYKRYDLSSLKTITYGTEPMPASALQRLHELFPGINLQQTYGLTEVGILRSKSRSSESLWLKIGGEDFQTRVVDGILQIKARSAMLGYLNAPSPFTEDGWFITGDEVECDGDYLRILGRRDEIINVGGEKVYPAAVESALLRLDNVAQARAFGQPNPVTGQVVVAQVCLIAPEDGADFTRRARRALQEWLRPYQVPMRFELMDRPLMGDRLKTVRNGGSSPDRSRRKVAP